MIDKIRIDSLYYSELWIQVNMKCIGLLGKNIKS